MSGRVLMSERGFDLTLERLACQLIEDFDDFNNVCMIGIQESGVTLAECIFKKIYVHNNQQVPEFGKLDITFYRDDYRQKEKPLQPYSTEINFLVQDKTVILIDDVLYTGRTVQAAMTAIQDFGRPSKVKMLSLVDRRFNRDLPIFSDYKGIVVDSRGETYVKVKWNHLGKGEVILHSNKNQLK
ncbi:MAG TPA: bifunctional pyr operon transcriptional regulator/uracil phosphoribosyltransferase PyrR [Saprospiraceae bacterium]|nr:bifunctional pyr operon transcriptional regulator/uracil phosphoribosyltransferase PyrR [Saprospiraceae bacterium]